MHVRSRTAQMPADPDVAAGEVRRVTARGRTCWDQGSGGEGSASMAVARARHCCPFRAGATLQNPSRYMRRREGRHEPKLQESVGEIGVSRVDCGAGEAELEASLSVLAGEGRARSELAWLPSSQPNIDDCGPAERFVSVGNEPESTSGRSNMPRDAVGGGESGENPSRDISLYAGSLSGGSAGDRAGQEDVRAT
ncbi:hypothetical protein CERSUDRAFT_119476 [Gelatoporia subvermispora B]|uniref:Uncharacterized protein n=1 Tax=Ceriporiopsis subvermispora (strain B) TaxID=914234 RepID=M2QHU5_CERS8|nr:hypothetical protein CERSUDRAFT_119476 [Gelatoporia subvermispora B]